MFTVLNPVSDRSEALIGADQWLFYFVTLLEPDLPHENVDIVLFFGHKHVNDFSGGIELIVSRMAVRE
jgi:hypothetical protein